MSQTKILCRYQYDPLDRLIGLRPLESAGTQRFYQQDELVTEIEGQAQRSILRHEAQPLAQRTCVDNVTETTLLATDHAHSPLKALAHTTSQQMAYTAYGHRSGDSGLSGLLGFNGELPDGITGHYLLGQGNRAFNPVLMRFNSPDELSPFGEGGINAYAYCGGDPINWNDPSGNAPFRSSLLVSKFFRPWETQPKVLNPRKNWLTRSKAEVGVDGEASSVTQTPIATPPVTTPPSSTAVSNQTSLSSPPKTIQAAHRNRAYLDNLLMAEANFDALSTDNRKLKLRPNSNYLKKYKKAKSRVKSLDAQKPSEKEAYEKWRSKYNAAQSQLTYARRRAKRNALELAGYDIRTP